MNIRSLEELEDYIFDRKSYETENLIDNCEEATPFRLGVSYGAITAYEGLLSELRYFMKHTEFTSLFVFREDHEQD